MPASPQILLVDDNRQALDTWTQLLRNQGHGIVEAIDPEHALVRLQSGGVGLVFSDMRMNRDDDGLELLRAVRTLHPAIPFVLYTGGTSIPSMRSLPAISALMPFSHCRSATS